MSTPPLFEDAPPPHDDAPMYSILTSGWGAWIRLAEGWYRLSPMGGPPADHATLAAGRVIRIGRGDA